MRKLQLPVTTILSRHLSCVYVVILFKQIIFVLIVLRISLWFAKNIDKRQWIELLTIDLKVVYLEEKKYLIDLIVDAPGNLNVFP